MESVFEFGQISMFLSHSKSQRLLVELNLVLH